MGSFHGLLGKKIEIIFLLLSLKLHLRSHIVKKLLINFKIRQKHAKRI